jgi:predicted dehydrogenase
MNTQLRVGIIGAGANTRDKHIPLLQAIPGVRIDVVCNRSRESSERVAREFAIPQVADAWREVIENPAIDAIMIGTWPYLHAPITLAALAAGKHVLCEARMAMNLDEARQMLAASLAHPECVAQIVPSPFTLPWDRCLQRLLAENTIGDLIAVDVFANSGAFANFQRPMTWRDDRSLSGLNAMGLGIYYEAMARWTGHARNVRANARVVVPQRTDANGSLRRMEIPDYLDVFGDLENGAAYHIRCASVTGACPTPNDFLLYGSHGTLRLDLVRRELTLSRPGEPPQPIDVPVHERGAWRVEEEFVASIRQHEPVRRTSFAEAFRYMHFTQAVADDLLTPRPSLPI